MQQPLELLAQRRLTWQWPLQMAQHTQGDELLHVEHRGGALSAPPMPSSARQAGSSSSDNTVPWVSRLIRFGGRLRIMGAAKVIVFL